MSNPDLYNNLFDDGDSSDGDDGDESDDYEMADEEEILELDSPLSCQELRDKARKKVSFKFALIRTFYSKFQIVHGSQLFTLEGFSADGNTRFARCDHRGAKRKRTNDVDCDCRLWISISAGNVTRVVGSHTHQILPWKVNYYQLKLSQNRAQDMDFSQVGRNSRLVWYTIFHRIPAPL
jgi:hypothetical protein